MRQAVRNRHDGRRRLRGLLLAALCLAACAPSDATAQDAGSPQPVRRAAPCAGKKGKSLYGMRFDVPKGMKSKKVTDVDYVLYYVYPKGNEKEFLQLWHGPHVGGRSPEPEVLESSTEVRQGEWQAEWNGGRDFSGRTRDGKRWRRTTMFMGLAVYEGVSEETARRFDEVIDGMCSDVEYMKKFAGGE